MTRFPLVIIGGGPAGYTASIYAGRANIRHLVVAGYQAGGQLMLTTDVENYPGFPAGVQGPELMEMFRKQAERFGGQFLDKDVTKVDLRSVPMRLWVDDEVFEADAVVVATGASAKWLNLPSEQSFRGRGVSSCATCDGFFFKGKDVVVVGGGDTAMEEANFLARICSTVTVVHRREEFRASKIMVDRAKANPKIRWELNQQVVEVKGQQGVTHVVTEHVGTKARKEIAAAGLFVAIGHEPNTKFLESSGLKIDDKGYVQVDGETTMTNLPGVFVAGDVYDHVYRQAITAAGSGCKAAIDAARYLDALAAERREHPGMDERKLEKAAMHDAREALARIGKD